MGQLAADFRRNDAGPFRARILCTVGHDESRWPVQLPRAQKNTAGIPDPSGAVLLQFENRVNSAVTG